MGNGVQMIEFDFWLCLIMGVLLLVCGIVGIIDDARYKKIWWRWVLDILAIVFGAVFIIWTL